MVPVKHSGQGVAEVAQKVPPVCDLGGLGRAVANPFGVSTGAVMRDDVDAGADLRSKLHHKKPAGGDRPSLAH